ncbi:hypothetical protein SODALDRAFT_332566 [Sodiomyces alkalinus F11]|uniref:Uncharacterized protein n=1 Tax=Sodiomyces alkalinus (strain CBS 110278 / VKM F-3762 / F11) TaxID=1314773 RepID=A0A3N2PXE6_SODAK|nr:hypothetical protein SODALDRAFT_332566 [Sodiomyces alkalinus F11]ROT39144.1 hypothetical protein SODALDRAFT_332566 [Sodiomyces alkalinus F11]
MLLSSLAADNCQPVYTFTTETIYTTVWTTNLLAANHESTWEATYTITQTITGNPADYRRPAFPPCFLETTVDCNRCAGGEVTVTITAPSTEQTHGVIINGNGVAADPQPVPVNDAPVPTDVEAPPAEEVPPEEVAEITVTLLPLPNVSETPGFSEDVPAVPPVTPTDVPDEVLEPETGNEVPPGAAPAPGDEDDEVSGARGGIPPAEAGMEAFVEAAAPSTRQGPGLLWLKVVVVAALILA